jgi:penicillin-binding protein 2
MMQRRIAIKNHLAEIQLTTQRSIVALVVMIVLVILLIVRLGFLQLAKHDLYTTLSKKNWLDLVPIEPTRGLIYDRNGVLLADNIPVFSLDIIPDKITNLPQTLAYISKIIPLSDTEIAQFQKELKQKRRFDEIPLKLRLTEMQVARFSENQYRFPGVLIKARLMRNYPLHEMLSHILGYVARINLDELDDIDSANYSASNYIGKLGIEKFYETELHGTVGYEQAENDASGEPLRIIKRINPIPGKNLYLTIDSNLQMVAEQALAGLRGAVVVIQPSTGQILAIASEPSYDPNLFVAGISNADFQALQQSKDRPLYNRALRGLYPFGSTIKPFIALEGLDSDTIDTKTTIFDTGRYKIPGTDRILHDWWHQGHGTVNVYRAIVSSCDTFFWELAHKMGMKRIDDILNRFGFGQLTGIDIEEELPGVVPSPQWKRHAKGAGWYEGDTMNTVIGQGFLQVTPLQLAVGVATLANRGVRMTPHLLLSEQLPGKTSTPYQSKPLPPLTLNNKNNWEVVINGMQGVITSPQGTGALHFGKNVPYTVAAKTGTAQNFSIKHRNSRDEAASQESLPEQLRDHSLFMAFAPVDQPEIAIAVIIENSSLSGTVARKILDYYLLGSKNTFPMNGNLTTNAAHPASQINGETTATQSPSVMLHAHNPPQMNGSGMTNQVHSYPNEQEYP